MEKIKVMFVCHGNICRSPMAEFLFKDRIERAGLKDRFYVESSATSTEALNWAVHADTKKILQDRGIDCSKKRAQLLTKEHYDRFDFFIGMDEYNRRNMKRLFDGDGENKVFLLLDFTANARDVADPWYTGDFNQTYQDIEEGITAFLKSDGLCDKLHAK